jgi:hypothetical protein
MARGAVEALALTPRAVRRLAAAALALVLVAPAPARAEEEGGEEAQGLEQRLREQMEKIVRLMRENEAALLEASRGGGKAPAPVDVPPPPSAPRPAPSEGAKPPEGGSEPPAPTPGEGGPSPVDRTQEIRKRMDELIQGSTQRGRSIPKELEELIRMIPVQKGRSQSPPDPNAPKEDPEARRRDDPKAGEDGKPETARGDEDPKPEDRDGDPPPDDAGPADPLKNPVPAWLAELPPEVQRRFVSGDFENVPAAYRKLVERYQKWVSEQSKAPAR